MNENETRNSHDEVLVRLLDTITPIFTAIATVPSRLDDMLKRQGEIKDSIANAYSRLDKLALDSSAFNNIISEIEACTQAFYKYDAELKRSNDLREEELKIKDERRKLTSKIILIIVGGEGLILVLLKLVLYLFHIDLQI
jgi:SMC interacting uncharacterized protein involved in chromosome segregation